MFTHQAPRGLGNSEIESAFSSRRSLSARETPVGLNKQ